jgi:uncharacterized protein
MQRSRGRLLERGPEIAALLRSVRTVAVLGMKTEAQADQPAFYVPQHCARAGLHVIPVPVYYPEVTEILGQRVYRKLADIPGPVDMVDVFRRSVDLPPHVDDILEKRPRAVWLQSGIRHPEVTARLIAEGIDVVESKCLMVELDRFGR